MKYPNRSFWRWMGVALVAAALTACGGGGYSGDGTGGGGGGGGDTTAPTASIDTPAGPLAKKRALTITFSESMDGSSLLLTGPLGAEALVAWSRTVVEDDTLTLTPSGGAWSSGPARALRVDAKDRAGNALATLAADYQVSPFFQPAEVVVGQADFASGQRNRGGRVRAETLSSPNGLAVSPAGDLFVVDAWNQRVLAYPGLPAANGVAASFALGQPNLGSAGPGTGPNSLMDPAVVAFGAGKMLVTDSYNYRVLVYNSVPADGNAVPDAVLGQRDFVSRESGCAADRLRLLGGAAITEGGKILVADYNNNRVLIWNSAPGPGGPDVVLGQSDFVHCDARPPTAATLIPNDVWSDGQRVVVADGGHHRVLIWNSFPTVNGQPADIVLGQASFTEQARNSGGPSARSMNYPYRVASNGRQLAIADNANNRVLIWNAFPTENFQPADMVLGQDIFTTIAANDSDHDGTSGPGLSGEVLYSPSGIAFHGDRLLVSDGVNNRVLVFRLP